MKKNLKKLTPRQYKLLSLIVDDYIKLGQPISSLTLLENNKLDLSSATIRNEMMALEENNFIEKAHYASGRIPTNKAYKWHLDSTSVNPNSVLAIKNKIESLFKEREKNIDVVIEESIKLINKISNTASITTDKNDDSFLEDLKVYKLDDNRVILLIVLSNGKVINNEVKIKNIKFEELKTIVNIFYQRMKGVNIKNIIETAQSLQTLILRQVKTLENKFKELILLLFKNLRLSDYKYVGLNNLITSDYLKTIQSAKKLIEIIETNSIWKIIDSKKTITASSTNINLDLVDKEFDNVSIISKQLTMGKGSKELTFIGPKRQDYRVMVNLIKILEENIKKWQDGGNEKE